MCWTLKNWMIFGADWEFFLLNIFDFCRASNSEPCHFLKVKSSTLPKKDDPLLVIHPILQAGTRLLLFVWGCFTYQPMVFCLIDSNENHRSSKQLQVTCSFTSSFLPLFFLESSFCFCVPGGGSGSLGPLEDQVFVPQDLGLRDPILQIPKIGRYPFWLFRGYVGVWNPTQFMWGLFHKPTIQGYRL